MININQLEPHPDNPRKDLGDLTELTASVKENGILQNLTVVHKPDGMYRVVIGHRRLAAAKQAGLTELPCTVANWDSQKQLYTMLEENMQRADLTIPEQAYGFQLMFSLGESVEEIAEKTGFSEQTVKHRLEIAKLSKKAVRDSLGNENWQMNIKDFILLEKVKDVKKRNAILKDSKHSHGAFVNMVNSAIRDEKRENAKKKWKKLFENVDIQPAPNGTNVYDSSKWKRLKEIDLDEQKVPERLVMKGFNKNEPVFMQESYGYIYLLQKVKKDEKELTPEEVKQKKLKKRLNKIDAIEKALKKQLKEFAYEVYLGAVDEPVNEYAALGTIWQLFMDTKATVGFNSLAVMSDKEHSWQVTWSEKEEFQAALAKKHLSTQLLVLMSSEWSQYTVRNYDGSYNEESGQKLRAVYETLATMYDFFFENEEYIKLIEGTHELFEEENEHEEKAN